MENGQGYRKIRIVVPDGKSSTFVSSLEMRTDHLLEPPKSQRREIANRCGLYTLARSVNDRLGGKLFDFFYLVKRTTFVGDNAV